MKIKQIRLDNIVIQVSLDATELDEVTVMDRRGVRKELWGSVIAHTNGEALRLFLRQD
jgi:hypothetical protein